MRRELAVVLALSPLFLPGAEPAEGHAGIWIESLRCVLPPIGAPVRNDPEPQPSTAPPSSTGRAGAWQEDFARICRRTEDAAWLPRAEVEELLLQSAALLERIERLEVPEARIYAFRLAKCKAFFEYSLELQDSRRTRKGEGDG